MKHPPSATIPFDHRPARTGGPDGGGGDSARPAAAFFASLSALFALSVGGINLELPANFLPTQSLKLA
jgi:hypothetical protein